MPRTTLYVVLTYINYTSYFKNYLHRVSESVSGDMLIYMRICILEQKVKSKQLQQTTGNKKKQGPHEIIISYTKEERSIIKCHTHTMLTIKTLDDNNHVKSSQE